MNCGQTVNILKENALRVISSAQALQSAVDSGFQYNSAFLPVPGYCRGQKSQV